jgi:adenylate cyclase
MASDPRAEKAVEVDPRSGFTHDAIRAQLDRILSSPEFHATDKMRDFLRFVVEEKLAGRSHRLKGYTIATRVFGRDDDFDASHDPIVRIQAGRLRRAIERYYLVGGVRDPILVTIPKGRYIPQFATHEPRALAGTQETVVPPRKSGSAPGPSVAVLPFGNLTGDPEQLALTNGLTEELITEMTRFQDIIVIPCQPGRRPADLPTAPTELGRAVGARFMLQGTVRRDTESVKVSAHLTDTADGRRIWADSYTHPLEAGHLIATQEEIALSVAGTIASEFGIIARRLSAESRKKSPSDLRTYEALLRYYSHQIAPSPESAAACFVALRSAVEKEPEYGPVWSALATLHCQMYTFDVPGFEDALGDALDFARKGVFLEPGSQLGRMILAYASYLAEDSESFLEESEIALTLNPNSPYTVGAIGYFHVYRGEIDRGLSLLERAISDSPCHPAWFHAGYIIDHLVREDYEQALLETRKHAPFMSFWDDVAQAAMLGNLGREDEATTHLGRIAEQKPDFAGRARELLRRTLKIDPLIDDLIDGLKRAGMRIDAS